MTKYFSQYYSEGNYFSKKKERSTSKKEFPYEYIWEQQPVHNDISTLHSLSKTIFLIVFGFIFMIGTYLITENIYITLILVVIIEISYILVFHDAFFSLRNRFVKREFNPFRHIIFWQIVDKKEDILFITNRLDLKTIAIKGFSIQILAETVSPSLPNFLKSLIEIKRKIPFTYQIVHTKQKKGNFKAFIYFMVFCAITGSPTPHKIIFLKETLERYATRMKSLFPADFHHFYTIPLERETLIGAFRSSLLQQDFDLSPAAIKTSYTKGSKNSAVIKGLLVLISLAIFNIYFALLLMSIIFIFIFNIAYLLALFGIWWKSLLFQLITPKIFRSEKVNIIDPFSDIQFLQFKQIPNILFAYVKNETLIGINIFTVNDAYAPPFCRFDKFYSGVVNEQIPFTYTVISTPLSFADVENNYKDYFDEKTRYFMLQYLTNDVKQFNWLNKRWGIWDTILTLSTTYSIPTRQLTLNAIEEIVKTLNKNGTFLAEPFRANFSNYNLVELKTHWIQSGLECEVLKTNTIWSGGSHLVNVAFQGTLLTKMIEIVGELKRAVEVRIPAEFNTPQHLENFLEFGHTINTETLKTEVPAGFTFEQLHSLLIMHGTTKDRNLLCMKIVIELIKKKIPSLIFDFDGMWTKLLSFFNKTQFQDQILYFKLGKTFTLNPFNSETTHDSDNLGFLELMFDAYALALKKDERFMNSFKNTIRTYEFNVGAAKTGVQSEPHYKKNGTTEALLKALTDFSLENLTFFHITGEKMFNIEQIINIPHTVIIDLSISQDLPKQCYLAFLILSKLIHYLSYSSQYISKFLILPGIDFFFESKYLDRYSNYGKVDKFFAPLIQYKFGLICMANEIRYLHPNVFNYFENIVTFSTTDFHNIAALKSHLNLNELHGTGFFTAKRNETYQDHYLRNMSHTQVIMKRSGIYQPFPVELNLEEIKNAKMMEYEEIINHMKKQGFDLEQNELVIQARAHRIKFQRDFRDHFHYIDDLIKFFKDKKGLERVAGLTKEIIKKELLKYIYPKAAKYHSDDKKKIRDIRDEIFEILIMHRYLIEAHPKSAGGSETMATCYRISPVYTDALQEYYDYKRNYLANVDIHVIQKEMNHEEVILPQLKIQTESLLKKALIEAFNGKLIRELFEIHRYLEKEEYRNCLKIAQTFLSDFLSDAYRYYYKSKEESITKKNIMEFTQLCSNISGFPFRAKEISQLLVKSEQLRIELGNLEQISTEIYQLFYTFYLKLNKFLNKENYNVGYKKS